MRKRMKVTPRTGRATDMKHRRIEHAKTVLIIILAVSAIFLGWQTELFNELFNSVPIFGSVAGLVKSTSGDGAGSVPVKEAARPFCIVITGDEGWRYGVKYDTDARNAVYDRTSSILGEALGAAAEMLEINENEWREALSVPGVFYEYMNPVKLSVLDFWLDAKTGEFDEETMLRRVFVTYGEEKNKLYYQNADSGRFYCAETASSAGIERYSGTFNPNGAQFAFETGVRGTELAPYMLILEEEARMTLAAGVPGTAEDILNVTLECFRRSNESYTISRFGAEGALMCIGAQFNITVDPGGGVMYRLNDNVQNTESSQALSESEIIERARLIITDTVCRAQGDAEVFYESEVYNDDGSVSVCFSYFIAGGRIYLNDDAYAAKITLLDNTVTEAEFMFRTYYTAEEFTGLLPEILALSAAGGEYVLCYYDSGQEQIQPFWLAMSRE